MRAHSDSLNIIERTSFLPNNWINGVVLSLDADTAHDINITAGEAIDSGNAIDLTLATEMTKQIDATWAIGDDAGGMFTGTVANITQYYFHLIRNDDTGILDAGFDTSATAANIPTGHTAYRMLGWVYTDGSANIDYFFYKIDANTLVGDIASSSLAAAANEITVIGRAHGFGTDNIMMYGNGLNINEDGLWEMDMYGGDISNIKLIGYSVTSTTNSGNVAPGANNFAIRLTNRGAGAQVINVRIQIKNLS